MAVDPTRAVPSVSAGSHARDRLLASMAVASEEQLTCLHVVCGAANERLLNEAVHLRRASRHVRFITVDALMRLTGLVEAGTLSTDQAIEVLRPPARWPTRWSRCCHRRCGAEAGAFTPA